MPFSTGWHCAPLRFALPALTRAVQFQQSTRRVPEVADLSAPSQSIVNKAIPNAVSLSIQNQRGRFFARRRIRRIAERRARACAAKRSTIQCSFEEYEGDQYFVSERRESEQAITGRGLRNDRGYGSEESSVAREQDLQDAVRRFAPAAIGAVYHRPKCNEDGYNRSATLQLVVARR